MFYLVMKFWCYANNSPQGVISIIKKRKWGIQSGHNVCTEFNMYDMRGRTQPIMTCFNISNSWILMKSLKH